MSTMDMAHWESRRNNEFVESVTYVAYEHIRHNTLFNIIYIMRTVLCGAGGLWWSDFEPGTGFDHLAATRTWISVKRKSNRLATPDDNSVTVGLSEHVMRIYTLKPQLPIIEVMDEIQVVLHAHQQIRLNGKGHFHT